MTATSDYFKKNITFLGNGRNRFNLAFFKTNPYVPWNQWDLDPVTQSTISTLSTIPRFEFINLWKCPNSISATVFQELLILILPYAVHAGVIPNAPVQFGGPVSILDVLVP